MKKFLICLLAMVMTVSLLAACGEDAPTAPQTAPDGAPIATDPAASTPSAQPTTTDDGKVDPFLYPVLNLTGTNGNAKALSKAHLFVYVDGKEYDYMVTVDAGDKSGSLKNGDTVHLKLSESQIESFKEDTGKEFSRTEADITVFGLNAYGDASASSGQHNVVNLNDYVRVTFGSSDYRTGEEDACVQFVLEHEQILRRTVYSTREDIAPEDLLDTLSARMAALQLFEDENLVQIVCSDHEYEASNTFTNVFAKVPAGESITVSFQVNAEALEKLQKVWNVEFTYSDFTATREN